MSLNSEQFSTKLPVTVSNMTEQHIRRSDYAGNYS